MNEQNTALITGATGFIGSHLCRRLIKDDWQVHIIVRKESDISQLNDVIKSVHSHQYDGSMNSMQTIFKVYNPDIVFHLASIFLAEHRPDDIEDLIASNILFGTQLVEAMVANGCHKLVNTGTSWQHFNNDGYNPVNLYAATKKAFEDILKYYVEAKSLQCITLKLFDTYGPNDPRPKLFSTLKQTIKTQEQLSLSPGNQLIDLVYIDDVIDAYFVATQLLLKTENKNFKKYAVSSLNPLRLRELIKKVEEITNTSLPLHWGSRSYRSREVMVPWNNGKILPGWSHKIGLEEGLRRTFNK